MAKLWAGRTSGDVDAIADDFNSSISFDSRMYAQDITGSMAHAAMLGAKGIIKKAEAETLIEGLQGILDDLNSGALSFDMTCEDIHMFVEQVLTDRLGDVGKKLHTARSRNDQVALDLRMYLRSEIDAMVPLIQYIPNSILFTLMGSLYVESLYSIPGMGGLLVTVIKRQDNTMVVALLLIYAAISILGLLFGDILMAILDPRISFTKKEGAR